MSGFKGIATAILKDLAARLPKQRATQRRKLSELVAGMLVCQTPNLMELSNVLDRPTESAEARYNYVERFLKNPPCGNGRMRIFDFELSTKSLGKSGGKVVGQYIPI